MFRDSFYRMIRTFMRLYREAGFPSQGFAQAFGWYHHCCPRDRRTRALDFISKLLLVRFEESPGGYGPFAAA